MALILWSDKFKTGVAQIDLQHQELVKQINALHDAMKAGKGKEQVGKAIEFLAKYTADHFRTEEALMQRHGYPGFDQHQAAHRDLVAKVVALIAKVKKGEAVLTIEVSDFLAEWVKHHISEMDMGYVPFFKAKNVA